MGETIHASVLLSTLGIIILAGSLLRRKVDFLLFFNVFFLLAYVLAPLHVWLGGSSYLPSAYLCAYERYEIGSSGFSALVIVVGYFAVVMGYHLGLARSAGRKIRLISTWTPSRALHVAGALLCVSFVAIGIYALQYGGLGQAMRLAIEIRRSAGVESGPFVFVKHFMAFSHVSLFLVFTSVLTEGLRPRLVLKVLLGVLSCLGVALTAALEASRGNVLILGLVLYLTLAIHKRRLYVPLVLMGGAFAVVFILGGKSFYHGLVYGNPVEAFSRVLQTLGSVDVYRALWREFMHPFVSLEAALSTTGNVTSPRLFLDWVYALFYFIPERLFPMQMPDTVAHINTLMVIGIKESIILPGLLGFLWYSGLLPGVVLGGVVFGSIGRWLDAILGKNSQDPLCLGLYLMVAVRWGKFTMTGEPEVALFSDFVWLILLCMFAASSRWFIQSRKPLGERQLSSHQGGDLDA